jgi:hypothetical protein
MFSPARFTITSKPSSDCGSNSIWLGCHSISPDFGAPRTSRVTAAPSAVRAGIRPEPTSPLAPAIAIFICWFPRFRNQQLNAPDIVTQTAPRCTFHYVVINLKLGRMPALFARVAS